MYTATATTRSNRDRFIPRDIGSPKDGLMTHLSTLGRLARLDFERCAVAGEVITATRAVLRPPLRIITAR